MSPFVPIPLPQLFDPYLLLLVSCKHSKATVQKNIYRACKIQESGHIWLLNSVMINVWLLYLWLENKQMQVSQKQQEQSTNTVKKILLIY